MSGIMDAMGQRASRRPRARTAAAAGAATSIVVGVLLLVLASAPTLAARVVSSTTDAATGASHVVIATPDGATASWTYPADAPGVGHAVVAAQLPGGVLLDPAWTSLSRDLGAALLLIGSLLALYALWLAGHPDPPSRTLAVPGDALLIPPVKVPGGGRG